MRALCNGKNAVLAWVLSLSVVRKRSNPQLKLAKDGVLQDLREENFTTSAFRGSVVTSGVSYSIVSVNQLTTEGGLQCIKQLIVNKCCVVEIKVTD